MKRHLAIMIIVAGLNPSVHAPAATPPDASAHKVQLVPVEQNVRLEVLDWGGNGPPLIFLSGLGDTAHAFDDFAPRFTRKHHVYGITRRGFGASSAPAPVEANYSADRLGDDVLAVMNALHLERPVLIGHSIAGEELSSIGSRHPEKISGLIYLDASYPYAFYSAGIMPLYLNLDVKKLRAQLSRLDERALSPALAKAEMDELLKSSLPLLQGDLRMARKFHDPIPKLPPRVPISSGDRVLDPVGAILKGVQKYGRVKVPVLAIYAYPTKIPPQAPTALRADIVAHDAINRQCAQLFSTGNPNAHVVFIGNSEHDVYNSNPMQVEREMNTFLDGQH